MKRVMKVAVLFVLVLGFYGPLYGGGGKEWDRRCKEYCAKGWPGNYQMQQFCYEAQREGSDAVFDFMDKYSISPDFTKEALQDHPPTIILVNCMSEWTVNELAWTDWQMVSFCIATQEKAWLELGGEE